MCTKLTRKLGDVLPVPQQLHEHVVGLEVAVSQAKPRQVAVTVEVLQPPRGLPEQLQLGAARVHRPGAHQGRERAARHGAGGCAGLDAGLHGEEVNSPEAVVLLLGAVDSHHVFVLRVSNSRGRSCNQTCG